MSTSESEIKKVSTGDSQDVRLQPAWEVFERNERVTSERLRVPGGWFIRSWYKGSTIDSESEMSTFFYPDANHSWMLKFEE